MEEIGGKKRKRAWLYQQVKMTCRSNVLAQAMVLFQLRREEKISFWKLGLMGNRNYGDRTLQRNKTRGRNNHICRKDRQRKRAEY